MAKVTSKYQITIPPKVREKLGIVPGAEVDIAKEVREAVMRRFQRPRFSSRGDLLRNPEFGEISFSASRELWVTFFCLGNRQLRRHSGPIALKNGKWDVSLPEPEF